MQNILAQAMQEPGVRPALEQMDWSHIAITPAELEAKLLPIAELAQLGHSLGGTKRRHTGSPKTHPGRAVLLSSIDAGQYDDTLGAYTCRVSGRNTSILVIPLTSFTITSKAQSSIDFNSISQKISEKTGRWRVLAVFSTAMAGCTVNGRRLDYAACSNHAFLIVVVSNTFESYGAPRHKAQCLCSCNEALKSKSLRSLHHAWELMPS